jgi:hypothetical protein
MKKLNRVVPAERLNDALRMLWSENESGLNCYQKALLTRIALQDGFETGCYPSQETLAASCGMSLSKVQRELKHLHKKSFIVIRRSSKFNRDTKSYMNRTNNYTANAAAWPKCDLARTIIASEVRELQYWFYGKYQETFDKKVFGPQKQNDLFLLQQFINWMHGDIEGVKLMLAWSLKKSSCFHNVASKGLRYLIKISARKTFKARAVEAKVLDEREIPKLDYAMLDELTEQEERDARRAQRRRRKKGDR